MNRLILILLCSALMLLAAAEVQVRTLVSRNSITPYESIIYQVEVQLPDGMQASEVTPPALPSDLPFSVVASRPSVSSSSRTTINNGRYSHQRTSTVRYNFQLTPTKSGTFTIPAVAFKAGSSECTTTPVTITVDDEAASPHSQVSVTQQITPASSFIGAKGTLQLKISLPADGGYRDLSPILPALDEIEKFASVDAAAAGSQEWARSAHIVNGIAMQEFTLNIPLVFTEAGSFTLPPFQCRAGVYDPGARRSSSSFFDEFFGSVPQKTLTFSSKPTTVDIQPLPTEKRPSDFAGLIGSITVEAWAEMTEFSVGDPVLLNLTIRGAAAPAFIKIPNSILEKALSPAFRVTGDDPPIAKDGGALLQRTIRAVSPDTVSIPALEIAYFDPEKGEYLTASTKPIPVTVKSARKITLNDASFADAKPADDGALREEGTEIKAAEAGRAPDRPLQELLKNHISPLDDGRSYAMYFAIPAALWLLLLAARFLPALAAASPAKRRAKAAAAKCLAALDSFKPENSSAMEELNGAFQELMGAKFNMTPGTITYQDIARKAKHLPPHQLETIRKFLELCENARYAGNAVSLADIDSDLRRLIREL